jgi:hypothetical protein
MVLVTWRVGVKHGSLVTWRVGVKDGSLVTWRVGVKHGSLVTEGRSLTWEIPNAKRGQ